MNATPLAPLRIAMWSGPRNISTAMMRAWENREDTVVVDEPFYACYLHETGVDHPGRDEVLAAQSTNRTEVATWLAGPVPGGAAIWYQKHMTQHIPADMPLQWLDALTHCFLIRSPDAVVASFTQNRPDAAAWELGFEQQARLFEHVCDRFGTAPPVIDASDVLADPRGVLSAVCARLGVAFSDRMLRWPPGPRTSDGVWAPYWYRSVEQSTGFAPRDAAGRPRLTDFQQRLADACRPHYERLAQSRLRA
ncbi:MAG TPA: hypothetical protein VFS55_15410 [Dokdonella sp.]|nr:hypothetical protein [Dokdonella sp.]